MSQHLRGIQYQINNVQGKRNFENQILRYQKIVFNDIFQALYANMRKVNRVDMKTKKKKKKNFNSENFLFKFSNQFFSFLISRQTNNPYLSKSYFFRCFKFKKSDV